MIIIIDNYDSFTYNLVQQIGAFGERMEVYRNDKVSIEEIEQKKPDHIIISPGPCTPKEAGISNDIIKNFSGKIPILGVCLGHQCIAYTYGADVVRARRLMHGKTSMIKHDGKTIYKGLPNPFGPLSGRSLWPSKCGRCYGVLPSAISRRSGKGCGSDGGEPGF